jgi:PAS domain S-box-containing protein
VPPTVRISGDLLDEVEAIARIGSYVLDIPAGRWVSSPGLDAVFGIGPDYPRTVEGWAALLHPAEQDPMLAYFRDQVVGLARPFDREYRIVRHMTGEERWVHGRGRLTLDGSGRPVRMIGTIADITDMRRAEARHRTLSEAVDQTSEAILIVGPTGDIQYANRAFERLSGIGPEPLGRASITDLSSLLPPDVVAAIADTLTSGLSWAGDLRYRRADGTERVAQTAISPVRDARGVISAYVVVGRDVTDERMLAAERERLARVVEQTSDSVVITDLSGRIEYVNTAFERVTGYRRDEVVGRNPRILKSGHQPSSFYRSMWQRLVRGQAWSGSLVNRRRDGTLFEEEATIWPIVGPRGERTGYAGVKRDVTALRAAESALAHEFRERAEVAAAMARIRPGLSAEDTATEICEALLSLPGIDLAGIITFSAEGDRALTLAAAGHEGSPVAPGRALPVSRARYLRRRSQTGPWAEAWRARRADGRYGSMMAAAGIRATAYAPIRVAGALVGLVAAGTRDEAFAGHLVERVPAVNEYAAAAGALLGRQLEAGVREALARKRVRAALAAGGLRPVYQPIVALESAGVVGWEALTRFADGTPPDRLIAEAHVVGLGTELELACLSAALEAAETLPADAWLSLNVSPEVIVGPRMLSKLLAGRARRILVEVTEHAEIVDYGAVRRAVEALGPRVELAVDDAGAGFASLRHVVELRPRFLKLDLGLVQHVHRDPTRQAMIAGLRHFAERIGCEVIAEGIESDADLAVLRELGVAYGQGRLFGPETSVPTAAAAEARPELIDGAGPLSPDDGVG